MNQHQNHTHLSFKDTYLTGDVFVQCRDVYLDNCDINRVRFIECDAITIVNCVGRAFFNRCADTDVWLDEYHQVIDPLLVGEVDVG